MVMLLDNLPNALTKLNAIFQAFSDLLFVLDENGIILDCKAGDPSFLSAAPESLSGRSIIDILPRGTANELLAALQQLRKNGTASPIEYSLKFANEERWFEARLIPSESQILMVVREITRHKKAEEKTQRQLRRLAALRSIDLAIASSLDLNLALSAVLGQVTAQLNADAADILLFNPHNNSLEFANGVGFRTEALRHTRLLIGQGYAGMSALKREVIVIPDLQHRRTGLLHSPRFGEEGFHTYISVPLIAKGRIRGVMEIFHRTPLSPDPDWLEFMETLAGQAAIAVENALLLKELQRSNFELTQAYDTTIEGWSRALDLRDHETEGHTQRVADMTLKLARRLGLNESDFIHVRRGAILHDIGKLAISDSILLKPAPLTSEEWDIVRQHPRYAYELLSPIPYLALALDIPHYHHEKWDGTGYPHGLQGDQIPLPARLFAIVDVYDAITSNRPYRPAWSREKALTYINEQTGKHFDPVVAREFLAMIEDRGSDQGTSSLTIH